MGVYHITYVPEMREICLYIDCKCNFTCHGCITKYHPLDCHLEEADGIKNRTLLIDEVISYLEPLYFEKVIFLGSEPTLDNDFLPLARILKEKFHSHNIFLTNGWNYVEDEALDEVCVSIKAVSKDIFKDFTGIDNSERVLRNFKQYSSSNLRLRAESVFIPDYIDRDEIEKIAKFIAEVNVNIPYRIDGYIPYPGDKFRRPTKEELEKAKEIAQKYLNNVSILYYGMRIKHKVVRIY